MAAGWLEKVWRSKSSEYFLLKLIINIPIGITLGIGYYYGVIQRLELRRELDNIIGAGVTLCIGFGWAVSKQIRSTSLLILPSMFTKEGRFWLSTIAYSLLLSGPIENIILNAEECLRGVSCSVSFLTEQHAEKLKLLNAPMQTFGRKIGMDITDFDMKLRQFVQTLSPHSISLEQLGVYPNQVLTAEQALYSADWLSSSKVHQSDDLDLDDQLDLYPEKAEDNSIESQNKIDIVKRTMNKRCKGMFNRAESNCIHGFNKIYAECKKKIPLNLGGFDEKVCEPIHMQESCTEKISTQEIRDQCNPDSTVGPGFEKAFSAHEEAMSSGDLAEAPKITVKEVTYERLVNQTSRHDITEGIKNDFVYKRQILEFITLSLRRLMAFSFILILRRAWRYHYKYRTDIQHDNVYVNSYFRRIENRREKLKKRTLLPLKSNERREIVLLTSLKLVMDERKSLLKGLVFWVLRLVVGGLILAADYILYKILSIINTHGRMEIQQDGFSVLVIYVNGTGPVSDTVRKMVDGLNYTYISNNTISNEVCLPNPSRTPTHMVVQIFLIFSVQLLMVAFEAYGLRLRRAISSFFYRKREKKRILYLYNEMLKRRKVYLRHARHQVRRKAASNLLQHQPSSFILPCLPASNVRSCVVCETRLKEGRIRRCLMPHCGFYYCTECWADIKGMCLACTNPDDLELILSELTVVSETEGVKSSASG